MRNKVKINRREEVKMIFLKKSHDLYSTAHGFGEFINWMDRIGEMAELENRAVSRKNIITAIAGEN
jgi:hypothetical protein